MRKDIISYIKLLIIIPIVLLFAITQVTILDTISISGIKPDILLLLVIFFGFRWGWERGFIIGLLTGFIKDVFSGTSLGVETLSFALTGIVAGGLGRIFYDEIPLAQVFISLVVCAFDHLFYIFLHKIFLGSLSLTGAIMYVLLPSSIYTALASIIIFFMLGRIYGKVSDVF